MNAPNLQEARPGVHNPHSNFDLSFKRKYCSKFGDLFPVAVIPINPDEHFEISYESNVRFAPFISQVYQDYRQSVEFFFVPYRLLYNNFELFMKGGWDGNQSYVMPYLDFSSLRSKYQGTFQGVTNLFNSYDIPNTFQLNATSDDIINAMTLAAYYRIYLDHFTGVDTPLNEVKARLIGGENYLLQDGDATDTLVLLAASCVAGQPLQSVSSSASPDTVFQLLKRLYPLDYFTSSRSNPQLGPVMTIPLDLVSTDKDGNQTFKLTDTVPNSAASQLYFYTSAGTNNLTLATGSNPNSAKMVTINGSVLQNTASIYDFYSAARVTELLNLYGYTGFTPEQSIAAEFGVKSKNCRCFESKRVFWNNHDLSIGEVFSNNVNVGGEGAVGSGNDYDSIAGVGTAVAKGHTGAPAFEFYSGDEYGVLIGLVSVYPEAAYSQGIPRHFFRHDRFDFPHPKLANLAMQDIKIKEIYAGTNVADWDNTFSYLPMYSEEKCGINRVNGQLDNSLNYLVASRRFSNEPAFNEDFLRVIPSYNSLNRTFNTTSDLPFDQPIFTDIKFDIKANRPLPKFGLFQI